MHHEPVLETQSPKKAYWEVEPSEKCFGHGDSVYMDGLHYRTLVIAEVCPLFSLFLALYFSFMGHVASQPSERGTIHFYLIQMPQSQAFCLATQTN